MRTETSMFFEPCCARTGRSRTFSTRKYTFLNERLAKHYGIDGVKGPDFRRVELTTDQRGGVLSQASVLTVSSYPTRTSPVIRGKYVLQNILGDAAAAAAAGRAGAGRGSRRHGGVAAPADGKAPRQRGLRVVPQQMDRPRLRTRELRRDRQVAHHGRQIPGGCRAALCPNGKSFTSPGRDAGGADGAACRSSRCLTEKMLTYALGRGLERYDRRPWRRSTGSWPHRTTSFRR